MCMQKAKSQCGHLTPVPSKLKFSTWMSLIRGQHLLSLFRVRIWFVIMFSNIEIWMVSASFRWLCYRTNIGVDFQLHENITMAECVRIYQHLHLYQHLFRLMARFSSNLFNFPILLFIWSQQTDCICLENEFYRWLHTTHRAFIAFVTKYIGIRVCVCMRITHTYMRIHFFSIAAIFFHWLKSDFNHLVLFHAFVSNRS